jgi:hypothetical protein
LLKHLFALLLLTVAGMQELPEADQLSLFTEHMAKLGKMMAEKVL